MSHVTPLTFKQRQLHTRSLWKAPGERRYMLAPPGTFDAIALRFDLPPMNVLLKHLSLCPLELPQHLASLILTYLPDS